MSASTRVFVAAGVALAIGLGSWVLLRRKRKDRVEQFRQAVVTAIETIAASKDWDVQKACVILSGGVDSSTVAEVGKDVLGLQAAFTVVTSEDAPDYAPAQASAQAAGLLHRLLVVPLQQLLSQELPWVVRTLQTFDPMTLRNSIVVAHALRVAAAQGYRCAVTGDGADELLGGYGFTHRMPVKEWSAHRRHLARIMRFDSVPLGKHLGMHVASPYTQPCAVRAALALSKADCVQMQGGPGGGSVGKVPLRTAFPQVTSSMRPKQPIEVGSGSTELSSPSFFDSTISDSEYEFERARVLTQHKVTISSKEQLHYYRVFRQTFPNGNVPGRERFGMPGTCCALCHYALRPDNALFCHTCGHYNAQGAFLEPASSTASPQ